MAMATSIDQKKRLSAADFLEAVEARLTALKPAELRAILMAHAETLPAAERGAFLAIFEMADEAGKAGGKRRPRRATEAERLLRDIEALSEQCGASRYEGRGNDWEEGGEDEDWDHYEPPHATWPTAKIDALFERTDAAFREGDLVLAREAYEKLLNLVAGFGEDGFDADEEEFEPVGATDLDEAKARYLRSLYETTEAAQRPAALLKALQDLQYVGGPVRASRGDRGAQSPPTGSRHLPGGLDRVAPPRPGGPVRVRHGGTPAPVPGGENASGNRRAGGTGTA
jgi:hypothetical protein